MRGSLCSLCIRLCLSLLAWDGDGAQGLLDLQHAFPFPEMLTLLLCVWGRDSTEIVSSWPGQIPFLLLQLSLCTAEAVTWEGPIYEQGERKEGLSKRAQSGTLSPFLLCTHPCPCWGAARRSGGLQLSSQVRTPSLCLGCAGAGAVPWWLLLGSGRAAVTQCAQDNQNPTPDAAATLPTPLLVPSTAHRRWARVLRPPVQCLLVETLLQEGARVS